MVGDAGVRIVREVLEGVMEPRLATATLLDAMGELGQWHDVLDPGRLEELARGPLRLAVSQRLGALVAADVTDRICRMLSMVRGSCGAVDTRELPFEDGPVRVLLVARTAKLGIPLRVHMGGDRIALAHASDLDRARTFVEQLGPELVVVDGADPPDVRSSDLLDLLGEIARSSTVLLWGTQPSWGLGKVRAGRPTPAELVVLDPSAGLEPLLDLVRARRGSGIVPRR